MSVKETGDRLEALARAAFADLQLPEAKLIRAAADTKRVFYGPNDDPLDALNNPAFSETGDAASGVTAWGGGREIRAEVIRWLCISADAKGLVDPRGIQIFGARVTGELDLRHTTVPFPLALVNCRLAKEAFLNGCQIPRLDLKGSWTRAIELDGVCVKQSVYLSGVHMDGTLSLNLAEIGGTLTCEEGTFAGLECKAIWADGIKVQGDVLLRAGSQAPFCAKGLVRLVGAEIRGDLDCNGGQFLNADRDCSEEQLRDAGGNGLLLERATIQGQLFLSAGFKVEGTLCLSNTTVTALEDDLDSWPAPGHLKLDCFTYSNIEPREAKYRIRWLKLDSSDATQPYRQLAKVLDDSGHAKSAKRVLIEMEKKISSKERFGWLKALIGYGYQPGNAIWLMVALWLIGGFLCWQNYCAGAIVPTDKDVYKEFQPKREAPGYYPRFEPLVFSLENTFPLVKLGQADKWQAASQSYMRWFIWVQILLGWLFATLFVAAVSGIVHHG